MCVMLILYFILRLHVRPMDGFGQIHVYDCVDLQVCAL